MAPTQLHATPVEDIIESHAIVKKAFRDGKTKSFEFRKQQLLQLEKFLIDYEEEILEAIRQDFTRPYAESVGIEIGTVRSDIVNHYTNLEKWSAPTPVETVFPASLSQPKIYREAKGAVLVLGAWNYNLSLSLSPLVGAISTGCTAVVKPSEVSGHIANLMVDKLPSYLDPEAYRFVNGAVAETTELLKLPWDHILYTGNGFVGKVVARAAAEHLTPVTLELGGKSPVVVLDDADAYLTARRVLWGKYFNAGQTCIAPDYVLASKAKTPELVAAFKKVWAEFNPDGIAAPKNEGMGGIINAKHYSRVANLIAKTKGDIVLNGEFEPTYEAADQKISPVVVTNVARDDPLMTDEIFGPVLPIVNAETTAEKVEFLTTEHDTPLTLYVFGKDADEIKYIQDRTRSGSLIVNDTMIQYGMPNLPFGGVGQSGYGNYRGERSFDTFTYERPVLHQPASAEEHIAARYPPYSASAFPGLVKAATPSIASTLGQKHYSTIARFSRRLMK